MSIFLTLAFLFFIGSLLGWCIEVIYRRFLAPENKEKKWVNPGFLNGPYLPLYGCALCVLRLLAGTEKYIPITNNFIRKALLFLIMAACVTAIEYIAGLIFIKGMHVELWNYSNNFGNVNGIICPLFSFFWALLSAAYYFFIDPHITNALLWLSQNLAFSFCIGFFYGIFVIDFAVSVDLLVRIRNFAEETQIIVKFEELKKHVREANERSRQKISFLLPMQSLTPLKEHLKTYCEKYKASEYGLKLRFGKNSKKRTEKNDET